MQQWFKNLQRQEQLMVLLAATVTVAYLLFVLLWQPMAEAADTLQRQNEAARETLRTVQRLAAEYQQLQSAGAKAADPSKQSITRLIDSSVKTNELTMERFQPSASGDVQVRFENAAFNKILAWLNQLEVDHGVIIKDLSISPGAANGLVNVSVRIHQDG
jgi:general secretion pathway protein M